MTTNLQPDAVPAYPYDPTGEAASNQVTETHTLSVPNRGEFNYIIPRHSPFFNRSVSIVKLDTNEILVYGKDYLFGGSWPGAQLSTVDHEPLSGIIVFTDVTVRGNYKVTYQTLGGEWVLDENQLIQVLRNRITNPFSAYWGDILGKPNEFPPAYHGHPAHGLDDYSDHIDAFNRLIDKLEMMVSRDIEDRPDYTQLIVSIINQGKVLNAIIEQLDNHDTLIKSSVQGQINAALERIKDTQAKASELVNDLDASVDRILNEKFDDQNNKLEALKVKLNQLIQELGNNLAGRVSNVENNLNLQGRDFTKKINDLGHRIDNDIVTNLNQLRTTLTSNLDTAKNELSRDIRTKVDTINNRINQVVNTIPDKLNPHFQSVTIDQGGNSSLNKLVTPFVEGTVNKNLVLSYDNSKTLFISTYPRENVGNKTSLVEFYKRDYAQFYPPILMIPTNDNNIHGWHGVVMTRAVGVGKENLRGGMVYDNNNKEILFPYNITGNKTADDWYNLKAKDFITHDGTHRLSQKLSLSGGTITGDLTVNGNIYTDSSYYIRTRDDRNAGIHIHRSGSRGNFPMWLQATPDKRWKFSAGTGHGNDIDFSIYLPAKGGTVALEGDMLPVGAIVGFSSHLNSVPGYLYADGNTFNQQAYPDLYRALGNRSVLPNANSSSDIGMTAYFATDQIPSGWIPFDIIRNTVTASNYPELYRILVAKYGNIANVPRVDDRYIRNAGNGLRVGDLQSDEYRSHTHYIANSTRGGHGIASTDLTSETYMAAYTTDGAMERYGLRRSANNAMPNVGRVGPTGSSETRPKTIVMKLCIKASSGTGNIKFWIKAFGRTDNTGTLNVSALENDIQALRRDKADRSHRHGISDIDGLDQRINTLLSSTRMQQHLALNGWVKFPDGILIQWARSNRGCNGERVKFNWPISFVEIYIATQGYTVGDEANFDSNLFYNRDQFWGQYQTRLDVIGIGRWK